MLAAGRDQSLEAWDVQGGCSGLWQTERRAAAAGQRQGGLED